MSVRFSKRVVALVGVLSVTAACGGGGDKETTTTSQLPTTTTAPPPPSPLTGLPSDESTLARPALVLKIDNHNANARPQAGINAADVVFEEQVEGGVTRLAAVFQSTDADPIGPIRSGRTTDIAIVTPLNRPLFGFSGANEGFLRLLLDAPTVDVRWDAQPKHYRRVSGRPAPHNLFTSSAELYEATKGEGGTPPALFTYRSSGAAVSSAGARPATKVTVDFGGQAGYWCEWTWDATSKSYSRVQIGTPHVDADGKQVTAANVIVQMVGYGTRQGLPEAELVGAGKAYVFTDGQVIEGTWRRDDIAQVTTYLDTAGQPISLTPGRTWVELPATGRTVTIDAPAG